tara:strand:- start:6022 stop:6696 length:675 start_codon:yes stop_codon:yes gene_type:complete
MKKLGMAGLLIALLVMSSVSVLAFESERTLDTETMVETETELIDHLELEDVPESGRTLGTGTMVETEPELIEHFEFEEDMNPKKEYTIHTLAIKAINYFMERFGLDENDSIGELLDALDDSVNELEEDAMEHLGVESEEEIREALLEIRVEKLRVLLELDESLTDEEVLEAAQEAKIAEIISTLGLEEDATQEEVNTALEEWKEDNKFLLNTIKPRFGFLRGLF